ncbi:MAG: hypothetical protein ACKO5E_21570 [bacterium]
MSDRRVKEREKVWGRRPVILRFDLGHPRHVMSETPETRQEESASALLASFLSSVISTGMLPEKAAESQKPKKKWYLVDAEGPAQRRPIEFQEEQAPAADPEEADQSVATVAPPKTRTRAFWRLQTPHISLNVFPPKTTT